MCLFSKRLDSGAFALPEPPTEGATHVEVDDATLETLLDGIEISPTPKPRRRAPRRVH